MRYRALIVSCFLLFVATATVTVSQDFRRYDPTNVRITGGTISNVTFSNTSTGTGTFTDVRLVKTVPTIAAGVLTLNLATANFFNTPLGANITTMTVSNSAAAGTTSSFILLLRADGTPRTIAWMSGATWLNNGGAAPTPSSTSGKCDKYTGFSYDSGTTWYVTVDAQNFTCGA